jgi:hypothetical protein
MITDVAGLFHAQAERVPRWVEEHPECGAGLVLVLGRAEIDHGFRDRPYPAFSSSTQ